MEYVTLEKDGYTITTHKEKMVIADIHRWLSEEAYWSKGIPFSLVKTAFDNSFCVGVLFDGRQVGYGRLVTDYASFAYLADVFVEEAHRGKGLSTAMMDVLLGMPWVKQLRRMMLSTIHAHGLYEKYGFRSCKYPDRLMEVLQGPDMYLKAGK